VKIQFFKYHGTGNDFILVDERVGELPFTREIIERMCNRHFGIGADGLICLRNKAGYDFEMIYYNSDGRLASMCGNGSRCITAFANQHGITTKYLVRFLAADGDHEGKITSTSPLIISVKMNDVERVDKNTDHYFLNTGSPHYIQFVANADEVDVFNLGRQIRNSDQFRTEGTNVNFVQKEKSGLYVRTYERGVEDETLSCGTGVIASAIASVIKFPGEWPDNVIPIRTRGGDLKVFLRKTGSLFHDIWLEGPAVKSFEGTWEL
jgi:diaminopimelate epimerase